MAVFFEALEGDFSTWYQIRRFQADVGVNVSEFHQLLRMFVISYARFLRILQVWRIGVEEWPIVFENHFHGLAVARSRLPVPGGIEAQVRERVSAIRRGPRAWPSAGGAFFANFVRTSEVRKVKENMRKDYITMESQQKN